MNEELKRLWKILEDEYDIHTLEDFRKASKATKLDIGIFTSPLKEEYVKEKSK